MAMVGSGTKYGTPKAKRVVFETPSFCLSALIVRLSQGHYKDALAQRAVWNSAGTYYGLPHGLVQRSVELVRQSGNLSVTVSPGDNTGHLQAVDNPCTLYSIAVADAATGVVGDSAGCSGALGAGLGGGVNVSHILCNSAPCYLVASVRAGNCSLRSGVHSALAALASLMARHDPTSAVDLEVDTWLPEIKTREPQPTSPFLSFDSSSSTPPPLPLPPHLHHPRHLIPLVHRRFQLRARGLQLCSLQLRGRGLQLRGRHFQLRVPPPPAS
uniref:Uncharacterized protein n=1 Tax=Ananas comosus var. bracteatus TaxID=296719 RepID=A0A6V7QMZ9_ANACO|nr:unnamed protein product [Ananas comosus var. bracteatus]